MDWEEKVWGKGERGYKGKEGRRRAGDGGARTDGSFFLSSECHASVILFFVIGLGVFASGKVSLIAHEVHEVSNCPALEEKDVPLSPLTVALVGSAACGFQRRWRHHLLQFRKGALIGSYFLISS